MYKVRFIFVADFFITPMEELQKKEQSLAKTQDKLNKYKDYLLGRGKLSLSKQTMLEKYRKTFI